MDVCGYNMIKYETIQGLCPSLHCNLDFIVYYDSQQVNEHFKITATVVFGMHTCQ